ncbi:hypothetical protein BTZ20_0227 [Rhodococcus sp. MTM3W5.2]|uniref:hypothetical protein n=1 Tax=Rhodococcus sp. MTM3W5.2 TaxID=1805827 RepID=UPI00097905D9|nr:hypothetical protein [Rhodococcus sp. MTM3W5.2]AQA25520.1 hypothetical protein BTZ20_0227 [Rhodococcus sp. MTM3W5.2]
MSRPMMRRLVSAVAVSALLSSGGLALGAGAASAAPSLFDFGSTAGGPAQLDLGSSSNGQELPASATVTADNLAVTKAVVGSNKIATTGQVTYRTTIAATGGPDRLVNKIADIFPFALSYVSGSATVTSWQDGQMKTEGVVPAEVNGRLAVSKDVGWVVSATGNKTVTFEVTYRVRTDISFDIDVFDSGTAIEVSGQAAQEWPDMGVKIGLLGPSGS